MIMALRKIENRGELQGATSSVMEMCFDNPHSGFSDLFSTHPAIDARIAALVQAAGGRDPGPIALPGSSGFESEIAGASETESRAPGPWEQQPSGQASWEPAPDKPNPWRS
jgi:heat shock protein HtpX